MDNTINNKSESQIQAVIHSYFDGLYEGDVVKLGNIFHEEAQLYGDIKGNPYYKKKQDYLEVVRNRKSPRELAESFQMKIMTIEVQGEIAWAKLHCPMLGYNYYDYLSLCRINREWKIVNKLFTHVAV